MAQRSASTHSCLVLPSCAHLEASSPPLPGPQWVPWWNLPEQPHAPDQTRRLSRLLPAGAVLTAGRRAAPSTPHPSTPHPPHPSGSAEHLGTLTLTPGARSPSPVGVRSQDLHLLQPTPPIGANGLQKQAGKSPASSIKARRERHLQNCNCCCSS